MEKSDIIFKLRYFIMLQNLFSINRSFWLNNRKYSIIGNSIFITSHLFIFLSIVYDLFINDVITGSISIQYMCIFHFIVLSEVLCLFIASRRRFDIIKAIKILDEKCQSNLSIKNVMKAEDLDSQINMLTVLSIVTLVVDVTCLFYLEMSPSAITILSISFAAHDSELVFVSLLIAGFNIKLSRLIEIDTSDGSQIYRQLLMTSAIFNQDFAFTVSISTVLVSI